MPILGAYMQVTENHLTDLHAYRKLSVKLSKVVSHNGKPVEQIFRMPCSGQSVVIDALNVVVDAETYDKELKEKLNNPDFSEKQKELIAFDTAGQVAFALSMMFGDDYRDVQYTGKGANFYRYAYRIGDINAPLGLICLGHAKSDTVLIMLYGEGCHYMPDFWESILYNYLTQMTVNPKITRVDLAHDDFDGAYSGAELANEADTAGKFSLTNRQPQVQHLGDWKRHDGRGRTLQVGSRESGKLYRGYEKGKQLGDSASFWFRHEVEISNKARVIPLDVLLDPTGYFVGCYPYCAEVVSLAGNALNVQSRRIEQIKKKAQISYDKAKEIVKHQFGKYLRVFRDFHSDKEILDMLISDKDDYYPQRLKVVEKVRFETPVIIRNYFDRQNQSNEIVWDIPYGDDLVTLKHVPVRNFSMTNIRYSHS